MKIRLTMLLSLGFDYLGFQTLMMTVTDLQRGLELILGREELRKMLMLCKVLRDSQEMMYL